MNNSEYRIRIKIGADGTEIEAQGDKAFVQEVFTEFKGKGAEALLKKLQVSPMPEGEKVVETEHRESEKEKVKAPAKKVPSRAPKYLKERQGTVDRVMKDTLPSTPPFRIAISGAKDLEHQCAYVLLLMKQRYEVEGLSASELAQILTKRFSIPAKAETIAKKLKKWSTDVDVVKKGILQLFQLTAGGLENTRHSLEIDSGQFKPKTVEKMMQEK